MPVCLGNPVTRTIVIHDCHPFVFTPVVWGTSPLLWTVPMRELRPQAGRGPSHRAASTAPCPLHPAPAVCVRRSDGAAEENQDSDVPSYDARHGSPPRVRSNFHLLKFTIMPSTLQKPNRFSALERSAKNHSGVEGTPPSDTFVTNRGKSMGCRWSLCMWQDFLPVLCPREGLVVEL